jgi:flagellar biosynthesis chaperone FliJ
MQIEIKNMELSMLLALYNQEINTLKSKLLNGVSWEEMIHTRRNIIELAIAIHKSHHLVVTNHVGSANETTDYESMVVASE